MYIALGQGQTAPKGQSFDVNRNVLSLYSFVASFKKMSLKSDFIPCGHRIRGSLVQTSLEERFFLNLNSTSSHRTFMFTLPLS